MVELNDSSQLLEALRQIKAADLAANEDTRAKALNLSRALTASLEDPVNRATEMVFSPYIAMAVRMAVDLNLFAHIESRAKPITSAELAEASGGEPLLVVRLCRLTAAVGFIKEEAEDLWSATHITHAMATAAVAAGHRFVWDVLITSGIKGPKFIRENDFKSPDDPANGFIQYAFQTRRNVFGLLNEMPSLLRDFNNFMGNTMGNRAYWYDWYPVKERLLTGFDPASALLIDVAGGRGHDIQAFHQRFPGAGRLILQDLPQALDGIQAGDLNPVIERVVYDFFEEQPTKGARVYFLHHILHDWSDEYALRILRRLREAMVPGYSKLLVHDLVLPNSGATAYQCVYDMTMMTFNSAMERSRKQWTQLLLKAGFEIVDFWVDNADADGLVEAIVPAD